MNTLSVRISIRNAEIKRFSRLLIVEFLVSWFGVHDLQDIEILEAHIFVNDISQIHLISFMDNCPKSMKICLVIPFRELLNPLTTKDNFVDGIYSTHILYKFIFNLYIKTEQQINAT